jgi:hypothetical protein
MPVILDENLDYISKEMQHLYTERSRVNKLQKLNDQK